MSTTKTNTHQLSDATKDLKNTVNKTVLAPHPKKWDILWIKVAIFIFYHIGAIYGAYLFFMKVKWQTCVCAYILYLLTMTSITAGVHRLWSHKSYKAKLPLRIILVTFYTMAYQYSVVEWVRWHRLHHKYCDTDADPHNSERGFFFSHMGWVFIEHHPQVLQKAEKVELKDIFADPLLRFQDKYYWPLLFVIGFLIPSYGPTLWGETVWNAFFVCMCFRYIFTLHATFLINSAAHMWGTRPYDNNIRLVETKMVSLVATGEGFHNYHHTFPWDYRAAELGDNSLNFAKFFIDFMAIIGWAYDLKTVPDELIERRVKRTGDGTHPVWGWEDPDLPVDDKLAAIKT